MNFYLRGDKMTADNMPVYVKIDDYKEVLETIADLNSKIVDAKALLTNIDAIKSEEESELESWKMGLDDVEQKLLNLNESLSQSR